MLIEKYLEGIEVTNENMEGIRRDDRNADISRRVRNGFQEQGFSNCLMLLSISSFSNRYCPAEGINPETDAEDTRPSSDDAPFAALAFKIQTDPYVGKLCYFRSIPENHIRHQVLNSTR